MMEFLRSCYRWVAENYKEITMILTSAQFLSLASGLLLLVKNSRNVKDSIASNQVLGEDLKCLNNVKNELTIVKAENEVIKQQLSEAVDLLNIQSAKVNAMLDVQSIVYSTIKDDNMRSAVNSILTNAKYSESTSRAKLRKEVEDLKSKLVEKMNEVVKDADKTVEEVKKIVNTSDDPMRY